MQELIYAIELTYKKHFAIWRIYYTAIKAHKTVR